MTVDIWTRSKYNHNHCVCMYVCMRAIIYAPFTITKITTFEKMYSFFWLHFTFSFFFLLHWILNVCTCVSIWLIWHGRIQLKYLHKIWWFKTNLNVKQKLFICKIIIMILIWCPNGIARKSKQKKSIDWTVMHKQCVSACVCVCITIRFGGVRNIFILKFLAFLCIFIEIAYTHINFHWMSFLTTTKIPKKTTTKTWFIHIWFVHSDK